MSDKEWMLNPKAIRHAKDCIHAVKAELGIKLTLSHPDFIHLLHEYVEMLDSQALNDAYTQLIAMAGPGTILKSLSPKETNPSDKNVIPLLVKQAVGDSFIAQADADANHRAGDASDQEMVTANGKSYPRFRDGKEFKGLYRGQPNYQ